MSSLVKAFTDQKKLRKIVRALNAENFNGFYGPGGRFSRAKSVKGVLLLYNFDDKWAPIEESATTKYGAFTTANGANICF